MTAARGKAEIGTPMVGFGYIEVSVHHMDLRPGLSRIGAYRMDQGGPVFALRFAAHPGPFLEAKHVPRPSIVMRARLDWLSLLGQSGVMGVETWSLLSCTSGVDDDKMIHA